MSNPTILSSHSGGVTRLTLNRPDKLNAFTRSMHAELREALTAAGHDGECRVVVLTGAGRAFSAGQDLADTDAASGAIMDAGKMLQEAYNPLIKLITTLEKPVIAAVNGVAAGAAANIAFACDLVYAARSASFLQAFARIGLIPDAGGTWVLPRLAGPMRARGLAMLAEPLPAETAEAWGLIWKCVDDDKLEAEVAAVAAKLATAPTYALALAKQALAAASTNTLADQLDLERDLQRLAGASPDAREGIRAFLGKRPPKYTGRKA
ncbi:MAG: 2-(1,2-epoxy-1,2-dihydrophenyl)acetyl-CoA isomerase PaaG [Hyphomonadaceae bacterium]|nr:2-(1,2-epoxy-1,2-dihydrophenyl)acetyl-CoA isomerase PaaG [Hyphomonadaceae bacterium]